MKYSNLYYLFLGIAILSSSIAVLCISTTLFELFRYEFDFSQDGLKFFFNKFNWCLEGIKISLTILGVIFVIERLQIMKENQFSDIIDKKVKNLEISLSKLNEHNTNMYSIINKKKYEILNYVVNLDAGISNQEQLDNVYNNFIKKNIEQFEKGSRKYKRHNGKYLKDNIEPYSIEDFKIICYDLLIPSIKYLDFDNDLVKLYETDVKLFAINKIVEESIFFIAKHDE